MEVMDLEVTIVVTLEEETRQMEDAFKFCYSTWAVVTGMLAL